MTTAPDRPYVLLSCAMSIDGYIDDATDTRLLLSNDADFDRVDEVRASCDAILVGASTVRRDNPRLLVRSAARREARASRGLPPSPTKVTITSSGALDSSTQFFTAGDADKIVYSTDSAVGETRQRLGSAATIVNAGEPVDPKLILADLAERGVRRLMVEGGSNTHTLFLTSGLADDLHLVVAPFFVGDPQAPRFVGTGAFPWDAANRASLAEVTRIGDVVLLRYALSSRFEA